MSYYNYESAVVNEAWKKIWKLKEEWRNKDIEGEEECMKLKP